MVVFEGLRKDKKSYRRFKIKSFQGIMIGLGYILKKIDFLSDKDIDSLNKIVINTRI